MENRLIQLGTDSLSNQYGYLQPTMCATCGKLKSHRKIDWAKSDVGLICVSCVEKVKDGGL